MKMAIRPRLLSLTGLMLVALLSLHSRALLADDAERDGFVPLWNGQDLAGWRTRGDWYRAADGSLGVKPGPGKRGLLSYPLNLWTLKKYDDFVLDLEYKIVPQGNSGVFLRSSSPRSYLEVQIADSHGKSGALNDHDCGALVDVAAPTKNMAQPAGQWNHLIITCRGDMLEVQLNGQPIVKADLTRSSRGGRGPGYIGLQDYGFATWFRNVRLKEL